MGNQNPPAGWYADPSDASAMRYWDGNIWTESTSMNAPDPGSIVPSVKPATGEPFYKKKWVIAVAVIVGIGVVAGGGNSGNNDAKVFVSGSPTSSPSQEVQESPTASPEETITSTPTPEESLSPVADSPVYFYTSASGDLSDMDKDFLDLLNAIDTGGTIRMATNSLEISFNIGQLESLVPPELISEDWTREFGKLVQETDAISEDISGEATVSQLKKQVHKAQAQAALVQKVVNRLK